MALTRTARGTGTHNSAATSFTGSPGSNCTARALLVLCVAADNAAGSGLVGIAMPTKSSARWIADGDNLVKSLTALGYELLHCPPGEEWVCRNKRFADFPDTAAGAIRAFDLRHGLEAA